MAMNDRKREHLFHYTSIFLYIKALFMYILFKDYVLKIKEVAVLMAIK